MRNDVPAVVTGLVRAVEELELVASTTDRDTGGRRSTHGSEVSFDLDGERPSNRVEHTRRWWMATSVVDRAMVRTRRS
jgi:hypothetical protein